MRGAQVGPVTPDEPIEWRIAVRGIALTLVLGLLCTAWAWWWLGMPGLVGAGLAVAVVVGVLVLSGGMMSLAARFGPTAMFAAALGGYVLKLLIYAVLIVVLRDSEAVHGPSLAITAAVLVVAALAWQTRFVLRHERLFWVGDAPSRSADSSSGRVVYTPGPRAPQDPTDPRSTERTSA